MTSYIRFFFIFCCLLTALVGGYHFGKRSVTPAPTDTIRLTDTCYLPGPVVEREIPVPVPADVDTAAILAAHFTKRVYKDEVVSTPMVKITVVDTVFQNALLARTTYSNINIPVRSHSLSIGLAVAPRHTFVAVGYRHKRWDFAGGWDFANRAAMVSAKYELFQW